MKKLLFMAVVAVFVLGQVAYGDTVLIDEDWSSYSNGDVPASPWVVRNTDANNTITVQDGWAVIDDGDRIAHLERGFGAQTELMTVSFKYTVD